MFLAGTSIFRRRNVQHAGRRGSTQHLGITSHRRLAERPPPAPGLISSIHRSEKVSLPSEWSSFRVTHQPEPLYPPTKLNHTQSPNAPANQPVPTRPPGARPSRHDRASGAAATSGPLAPAPPTAASEPRRRRHRTALPGHTHTLLHRREEAAHHRAQTPRLPIPRRA